MKPGKPRPHICPGCYRRASWYICGRCWRWTPAESKMALREISALASDGEDELQPFYRWAFFETIKLGAKLGANRRWAVEAGRNVED